MTFKVFIGFFVLGMGLCPNGWSQNLKNENLVWTLMGKLNTAEACNYPGGQQIALNLLKESRKTGLTPSVEAEFLERLKGRGEVYQSFDQAFFASLEKLKMQFPNKPNDWECQNVSAKSFGPVDYEDYRRAAGIRTYLETLNDVRQQAKAAGDPLYKDDIDAGMLAAAISLLAHSDKCGGWPDGGDDMVIATAKEFKDAIGLSDAGRERGFLKSLARIQMNYPSFEAMFKEKVKEQKVRKAPMLPCKVYIRKIYEKNSLSFPKAWAPVPASMVPLRSSPDIAPPPAPAPKTR